MCFDLRDKEETGKNDGHLSELSNLIQNANAQKTPEIFIALGSNLTLAIEEIRAIPNALVDHLSNSGARAKLMAQSRFYQTPAFPDPSDPDFVNAVFQFQTDLTPETLLTYLHEFEAKIGRTRPYRWAPRVLDLDLLFYGDLILPNLKTWQSWAGLSPEDAQKQTPDRLILPHPRAHERGFVLGPLRDIAPDFVHPVLLQNMETLWNALPKANRDPIKAL